MKPRTSKFLNGLAVFALWLYLTLMGWMGCMVLLITLNGGHPRPYDLWLSGGVIPAGIGGFVASCLYIVRLIIKKRHR